MWCFPLNIAAPSPYRNDWKQMGNNLKMVCINDIWDSCSLDIHLQILINNFNIQDRGLVAMWDTEIP